MTKINNPELFAAVRDAQKVFICTHIQPDGDAFGSALALYDIMHTLGKEVVVACDDPVPVKLRYLRNWDKVVRPESVTQASDLSIAVDASGVGRIGACADVFFRSPRTVQIDHHTTNTFFAQVNEVDSAAAASGILVTRLALQLGCAITPELATCLYTAISSDTGNFSYGNITGELFEQMALLMEAGLPLSETARTLHLMRSKGYVQLLGRALSTLRFVEDGRIAGMWLTLKDFEETGALREESDGIVNEGLYINGVEMSYLATETSEGIKFSLRSIVSRQVSGVAASFGGGGHAQAAGCLIEADMPSALDKLELAMTQELHK